MRNVLQIIPINESSLISVLQPGVWTKIQWDDHSWPFMLFFGEMLEAQPKQEELGVESSIDEFMWGSEEKAEAIKSQACNIQSL